MRRVSARHVALKPKGRDPRRGVSWILLAVVFAVMVGLHMSAALASTSSVVTVTGVTCSFQAFSPGGGGPVISYSEHGTVLYLDGTVTAHCPQGITPASGGCSHPNEALLSAQC